jgi:hypothetical protein
VASHILLNSKGEVAREDLENGEEMPFSRSQVISGSEVTSVLQSMQTRNCARQAELNLAKGLRNQHRKDFMSARLTVEGTNRQPSTSQMIISL